MGNFISKHNIFFWYWSVVFLIIAIALGLTGIAFAIPFSVPAVLFVFGVIWSYFVLPFVQKKTQEKEHEKEDKIKEREHEIHEPIEFIHRHKIEPPVKPEPVTVPTPPTPYFAHPYPLQKNFTGRIKERTELTDWLDSDSPPVFVYSAIGGMGKSALAWYWLNEDILKRNPKPEGVIWWSFYDKEAGFENFLNHAIEYASCGKTNPKEIASTRDKMDKLQSILIEKQFLLVLDGVERVLRAYAGMGSPYQGDEVKENEKKDYKKCVDPNCERFLEMLAGIPKTKTLITTRICPEGLDELKGVKYKKLTQMDKADAVEFFEKQGVKGTRAEIEKVCCAHGYHPLCLRLLSGMIVKDMKYAGDIKAWTRHNPLPELVPKEHHILALAYDSLDGKKRALISKISAFRNPMDYDSLLIFNDFGSEEKFNDALIELTDRGLLFRDEKHNKFDLHPIVRKYCYDRLTDKKGVHSKLRDYFDAIPAPAKVESVDDLAAVIELYHHTVGAGRYDEAMDLFYNRFGKQLHFRFGAYQTIIELLRALFPDGEDKPPKLKDEDAQAWTLNALGNSYALSGQPGRAVPLFEMQNKLREKAGDKKNLAVGLGNLAQDQILIGELDAAESNLRRSIEISREIKDEFKEAVGHQEIGRLLAYRGNFEESKKELEIAIKIQQKIIHKQTEGLSYSYSSIRSLLMSNADEALNSAKKSCDIAFSRQNEADKIRAEYLLSAAYLMKGNLIQAENHLTDALTRDRKINLVELEPDILLEFAKLRFRQGHKEESLKFAREALLIADRCEYRLKQADIHNFLAEFYFNSDAGKAKEHAGIAKERAECGYAPALAKARGILNKIRGI
ncbi:hypothetical protein BEH94_04640 [Candidatus Altiarchaeales archaeon WOR_SM1_SCG]|nr:hypothetical protein BEH94_04640 [Candidatus Altiarchaeales archaeon WOR_SM1_SCG]